MSVDERQARINARIEHGFQTGALTRREARQLERQLALTEQKERAYRIGWTLDRTRARGAASRSGLASPSGCASSDAMRIVVTDMRIPRIVVADMRGPSAYVIRTAQALACAVLFCAVGRDGVAAGPPRRDDARHLLARTGFGPTAEEIRTYARLTREQAVDRLLRDARDAPSRRRRRACSPTTPLRYPGPDATEEERAPSASSRCARDWSCAHGGCGDARDAVAAHRADDAVLAQPFRVEPAEGALRAAHVPAERHAARHALGNFGALLHAAAREPAMLVYLDVAQKPQGQPNENFAREVMELFTLGEGHYTEQDVKEAARAFTGWRLDRETGAFLFRPALHDGGVEDRARPHRTLRRRRGARPPARAAGDRGVHRHEAVARVRRRPSPMPREVKRIARRVSRARTTTIKAALRELLLSDAFYAPRATAACSSRARSSSSSARCASSSSRRPTALPFAIAAAGMGQNLFSPPNVKGWPGGEAWINSEHAARAQAVPRSARRVIDAPAATAMRDARPRRTTA